MKRKISLVLTSLFLCFNINAEDTLGGTLTFKDKAGDSGELRISCSKRLKDGSCLRFNIDGNSTANNLKMLQYSCKESKSLDNKKTYFLDSKRQTNRLSFSRNVYKSMLRTELEDCQFMLMNKLKEKYGKDSLKSYIALPFDLVKTPVCLAVNNKIFRSEKILNKDFNHLFDEQEVGVEKEVTRDEWSSLLCGLSLK